MPRSRTVLVPAQRLPRWFENFERRHGPTTYAVDGKRFTAIASDRETAVVRLPFGREYDGAPEVDALATAVDVPVWWGILLVRRGGFAVARLHGGDEVGSKVGTRHVQGRTKAGGQSQQRFARRRDNQARVAFEAAADHAHRILTLPLDALVCGGDRVAVDTVLADTRLAHLADVRTDPWLPVPDPRRAVLDQAIADARSASVTITTH